MVLIIQPWPTEVTKGAREELKQVVMQCLEPFLVALSKGDIHLMECINPPNPLTWGVSGSV